MPDTPDEPIPVHRIVNRLILLSVLLMAVQGARAGGPRWVAGSSYFNPSAKGQAIAWANGQVSYFTDLGALSPQVSQAQANTMVATAASVWSTVPTAAVAIRSGGSLAEDVNGSNVTAGPSGVTLPADLQATATSQPVAVVYDQDGSVINALYGAGASAALSCPTNGVLVSVDNLASSGNIVHAVMLVNGLCATTTTQIANLQYQLVRGFGRVLGLDWSQTNEEMFDENQPTTNGLQGWPIMHPVERLCNGGTGLCMPNPTQLRPDDIAALNRLYPVTAANLSSFFGKVLTAPATISVQGTIQFPRGQGMEGVNVVLRPVLNGVPDVRYTVTAVSGVFFQGNGGNPVTGTTDASGNPLNRFGSDDTSLEGFFDLSGVPLPPQGTSADYQLTFEPINPLYTGADSVGPYITGQTSPSGTMAVIDLGTLGAGSAVTRAVAISDAAETPSGADGTEMAPAAVPVTGEWTDRLTGYGHNSWFQWWARCAREFTVEVLALDESGNPTAQKAEIVVGAWNGSDLSGSAPVTGTVLAFNGNATGLTTLPVLTVAGSEVRIGVADQRGDGRPDYAYRGRILYADSVTPARLPASGGSIVIQGMGFRPSVQVSVAGKPALVTSVTPNTIVAVAPASGGITGDVVLQVLDPQTLGIAAIAAGFGYDALGSDAISIVTAPMGSVPVGVPQLFTVRALDAISQTPAAGVTVTWSLTGGTAGLGCGESSCSVVTAGDGTATLVVTANAAVLAQVTASLTNGSSVIAEFTGTAPPAIAALTPSVYLALRATAQWPMQAIVVTPSGVPVSGQGVAWSSGGASISLSSGLTASGSGGIAQNQLTAGPFSSSVAATANACLPNSSSCATFTVIPVHPETAVLSAWMGTVQFIARSESFAPVSLLVTDAFGHPLVGATVTIAERLAAWTAPCPNDESCVEGPTLGEQVVQATSGLDGTVTITPLAPNGQASRLAVTAITGGTSSFGFELDAHP
ncbi:MAG TPA: IPT/TIG domain-containing protein [Acidobacteriaceae bacterium]|nr:IPT/TIG domain-containing protein [Acidobacteriaceae bacterium]